MRSWHTRLNKHERHTLLWLTVGAVVLCLFLYQYAAGADTSNGHQMRIGYVIPSNRTAQAEGPDNLRYVARLMQGWYREQMDRNGFGPKTFEIETEADGVTPVVHVVGSNLTDAGMRGTQILDLWSRTENAMIDAGLPLFVPGEAWLIVPETHELQSDGTVIGDITLGGNMGPGGGGGVGMTGSSLLSLMTAANLQNPTAYDGMTIPEIGPYPLVYGTSYPTFSRPTIGNLISTKIGGAVHEFGHGLRLPHDARNDTNFHGNLMFNGFRGFRGSIMPEQYPAEDARLSYASALMLNQSRFLNPDVIYTEDNKPTVQMLTSGDVDPVNGLLRISFTATDDTGLAVATLRRGLGATFGEMILSGTSTTQTFETPYYDPGVAVEFYVDIIDTRGNTVSQRLWITPSTGFNRAPQPSIRVFNSLAEVGGDVLLDATSSVDPDGNNAEMTVEWDLDGDGIFDTAPTTEKTLTTQFNEIGTRLIYARLTDPTGDAAVSTPSPLRVMLTGDLNDDGFVGIEDLNTVLSSWNQQVIFGDRSAGDPTWDGFVGIEDLNWVLGNWNAGTPPPVTIIPEPSPAIVLIGLGWASMLRRCGGRVERVL
jgi:hypothetical protein